MPGVTHPLTQPLTRPLAVPATAPEPDDGTGGGGGPVPPAGYAFVTQLGVPIVQNGSYIIQKKES